MEDASRYAIRKPAEPLAVITPPEEYQCMGADAATGSSA